MSTELVEQNGFGIAKSASLHEVGAVAAIAREESEIKAACAMAKRFPRDEAAAYAKLMKSCERKGIAENAQYSFKRGGSMVEGPSVDMAREAARCWGNVRYGLRIVSLDELVHIKGYALDLETNNYVEMEDKFAKKIQRKNRDTNTTIWIEPDERDLRELINRRGAILVRNALLQVLPPDVVDDAVAKCLATLRSAAKGELKSNKVDALRKLTVAFDAIGVNTTMLERYLGHDLDLISEDEIVRLRGIFKSISDGNSKREEHFVFPESGRGRTAETEDMERLIAEQKEKQRLEAEGTRKPETMESPSLPDSESDLAD